MAEYIEREKTIKRIQKAYCADCNSYNGVRCRACGIGDAIDMIEDAPAADVAPVVHGHSVDVGGGLRQMLSMRRSTASLCQLLPQLRGDNGR